MGKVKAIQIKCPKCGKWFDSPIFFGDFDSFDSSTMIGNKAQCPCGVMVDCNKENMRVKGNDEGFLGNKTS